MWLAISVAPCRPPEVGFHDDHAGPSCLGGMPTMATVMPTRAAMPTATSAPVRNWKRGA